MGTMNPRPDNPGLPRFDSSAADSPFAPRTPNSYMGSKIVITALLILVVIIFFFTAYRVYVHVVWRRHRRPIVGGTSRRHNQDDSSQGLDKAIVDTLPTFTYMTQVAANVETGATECAVCLVEFQDNDACRLLPKCNHSFHTECIDKWFLSHTTCPMCRTAAEMVVDADGIRQAENVRACLLPHAEDGNEQMQRLDSSSSQQEISNGAHRLRSRSSACIPIDEDTANEIQISRTRSISLFSGEHEERLGRHMHQILSRTFSSRRANGRYDMVQQEAHNDMHSIDIMKEITPGNGYIAEGDVQRNHPLIRSHASEILVQHANLPHWQRSASDRYLNLRQGSQYPMNVLFWGNDSHVLTFPCEEQWRVGGRSLSHSKSNLEVPRSQDGFFRLGHSPLGSPLRCIATGEAHQPSSPAAISQQQAK